ncbi:MAG: hypothetical protein M1835_008117 [Candelina submexicana]|nr:MAG: hypothetical protein M1835_008117 [Candelina submexicana]
MSSADHPNVVRFDDRHVPTPVNASPATYISLNLTEALDLWSHAVLLFHAYEWEQAVTAHRRLIKRCESTIPLARLWFNVGVIRSHLGEYFLASEAFIKAVKIRKDLAIGWFCLGMAVFQLGDFRKAKRPFQRCLSLFGEATTSIDYRPMGLDFILEKTKVEWNARQTFFEKNHKQMKAPLPLDTHLSLNRLPAGKVFQPRGQWTAGAGFADGAEFALSSSISSSITSSTLSSGSPDTFSPGRRTPKLLRKSSKRRFALGRSASRSLEDSTLPVLPPNAPPSVSNVASRTAEPQINASRSTASSLYQHKPLPPLPFVSPEALRTLHKRMNLSSPHQDQEHLPALLLPSVGKSTTTYSIETASRSNVSLVGALGTSQQSSALRSVENLLEPMTAHPALNSSSSSSSSVAGASSQPISLSRANTLRSGTAVTRQIDRSQLNVASSNRGRGETRLYREDNRLTTPQHYVEALPEPPNPSHFASQRYGTPELEDFLTPAPLFSSPNSRSASRDRKVPPASSLQTLTAARYDPNASSSRSNSVPRKPVASASSLQTLTSVQYEPHVSRQHDVSQLPMLSSARYDPSVPNKSTTSQEQTLKPVRYDPNAPNCAVSQPPRLSSLHQRSNAPDISAPSHLPTLSSARYDPKGSTSREPNPSRYTEETHPQRIDSYAIFGLGKEAAQAAIRKRDLEARMQGSKQDISNVKRGPR